MVKHFSYDARLIAALEASLSTDRLTSYLSATSGDKEAALRLYAWNTAISAAFYVPLQGLEVTLRNALHRELTSAFGVPWYDLLQRTFAPKETNRINEAKATLARSGKLIDPPHIVAELPFGFWISLLGPGPRGTYHNRLWIPALHKGFPHTKQPRKEIHRPLDHLRLLRNRIAHHEEPIFRRHLAADYETILRVLAWVSPEAANWVDHHATVLDILAERP
ncbi:MAG TPA: hypothetical protein VGX03_06325 [Candidatus Binatia bacterium]|nr:hypothetical protein [Candidatus Binatia bacterium]